MTYTFSNSPAKFAGLAEQILEIARLQGASHAQVSLAQSQGLNIHMRQGSVLSRARETHSGFSLTVFNGQKQGSVNSTDLSTKALEESVKAACAIARYTGEDPAAGPASAELLCREPLNLQVFHPWGLEEDEALNLAELIETGITDAAPTVQSEGAWVSSSQSYYQFATTEGFNQGVAQSFHNMGASALARNDQFSEIDFWSNTEINPSHLPSAMSVGRKVGLNAQAYLDRRPLNSMRCPVLFNAPSATSLLEHIAQAISSRPLYTNASFLKDQLGQSVMAKHLSLREDPYIIGGKASIAFDSDGIAPKQRDLIKDGVLEGFLLSLYGARRLGMQPTGNGFGPSNLRLYSCLTLANDNFETMLKKMGTGLLVTSLAGNGVRLISGDYSRGARGFWIEDGQIKHAVVGITIAANLKQMLSTIAAVGSDVTTQGSFTTGSILIEQMQISAQ